MMTQAQCNQCGQGLRVWVVDGVTPANLALFERGHDAVCPVIVKRERMAARRYALSIKPRA